MGPNKYENILWFADLQADFSIKDTKKFRYDRRIVLVLERKSRSGICSGCGAQCFDVHSSDEVEVRDLSCFGYDVWLKFPRFTFNCVNCRGYRIESHWLLRKKRAFTWRFECEVSRFAEEMTNASVGRLLHMNNKTVYRIDYELLNLRLQKQVMPELGPHYSMDEVHFRTHHRFQQDRDFVTHLLCLKNRKVISTSMGRSTESAVNCINWLSLTQRRQAKSVAVDLHAGFHKGIEKMMPNAVVVLDRFHIMQLFSEAMNDFRKLQLQLTEDDDEIQLLKGRNKWLLLTRETKLSKIDRNLLKELKALNERIIDALMIREYLQDFFSSPTLKIAKIKWYRLQKLVREVDIAIFNEFFRKLSRWGQYLWNYFEHKTTSATIEAINHKIKVVRAQAYGYRNPTYFRLKILQRCGFLNTQFASLQNLQGNSA